MKTYYKVKEIKISKALVVFLLKDVIECLEVMIALNGCTLNLKQQLHSTSFCRYKHLPLNDILHNNTIDVS